MRTNYEAPHYVISSILLLPVSSGKILCSALCNNMFSNMLSLCTSLAVEDQHARQWVIFGFVYFYHQVLDSMQEAKIF
jgi:hypothetical protein